jgi:hypothetical protein
MNRVQHANGGPYRISHHINRNPAVNIHHATRYSEQIGLPLNRFITINFTQTSCPHSDAGAVFRRMLAERFAPWFRRTAQVGRVIPPTYVWSMEGAGGQAALHWLVHIPAGQLRAFERKLFDWLASLLGEPPAAGVVKVQSVYNLVGARRYILKGTDPIWAKHLGVRAVDQGVVIGKRSGFSKNLGPAARKRAGYRPRRMPSSLSTAIATVP